MYYRNSHAALVVYDLTSQYSFRSMQKWVNGQLAIIMAVKRKQVGDGVMMLYHTFLHHMHLSCIYSPPENVYMLKFFGTRKRPHECRMHTT